MSRPVKRSFTIRGHRTSISLEAEFWAALKEIAAGEGTTLAGLVEGIDERRGRSGLSGAVRVYVLAHFRRAAEGRQDDSRAFTSSAKSS
ncbi:MAG: ribbon-helix-helix domain-containing protein [Pseudomonadota bacterium]